MASIPGSGRNNVRLRTALRAGADAPTNAAQASAAAQGRLELLQHMLEELSADQGLEPLLTQLLAGACSLFAAVDGAICLHDAGNDVMRVAAVYRRPASERGREFARGQGLPGRMLVSATTLVGRYGDFDAGAKGDRIDLELVGVPIEWRGQLRGSLEVSLPASRHCDVPELELLLQVARHAAISLQHAEIYARERHRTARFELIARIAGMIGADLDLNALLQRAADAIHETLGFPAVDIPVIDPGDPRHLTIRIRGGSYKRAIRQIDRIPVDRGIMGSAVRERRAQLVNNVAKDPRYIKPPHVKAPKAELAVPILRGIHVLGVINVESDREFNQLDVSSLEIIAEFLAVAMHNARLYGSLQESEVLRGQQHLAGKLHNDLAQLLAGLHALTATLDGGKENTSSARVQARQLTQLSARTLTDARVLIDGISPLSARPTPLD